MSRDTVSPSASSSAKKPGQTDVGQPKSPEIAILLDKVKALLDEHGVEKALEAIARSKLDSPWVTNATAVCLLRHGETKRAKGLFHGLVAGPGGVSLRSDVPTVFLANYAASLLVDVGVVACQGALNQISDAQHPAVQQLQTAIQKWKKSLSLWEKFQWCTGDEPQRPVTLDFALGAID